MSPTAVGMSGNDPIVFTDPDTQGNTIERISAIKRPPQDRYAFATDEEEDIEFDKINKALGGGIQNVYD